jgi:probable F420-dependent oxidoreductase
MRFYLALAWNQPSELLPLAAAADKAGFDGVALSDHLVFPATIESRYPYAENGKPHWLPTTPWPDVWVTCGFLASMTSRIRFLTNIYVLPSRDPFVVAKAVGTVAVLSGNRVTLGAGVGWMKEEFDLVDKDFHTRGRRANEMIDVMRALWTGEMVEYHGEHFDFAPLQMSPAPTEPVPIFVGGYEQGALNRAARLGQGWVSTRFDLDQCRNDIKVMESLRSQHGREHEPFEYVMLCPSLEVSDYERREAIGVNAVQTQPWTLYSNDEERRATRNWVSDPSSLEFKVQAIERFTEDVIVPLRESA